MIKLNVAMIDLMQAMWDGRPLQLHTIRNLEGKSLSSMWSVGGIAIDGGLTKVYTTTVNAFVVRNYARSTSSYTYVLSDEGREVFVSWIKQHLTLASPTSGMNRQWVECDMCGLVSYYDFTPYGLGNPITWMKCGHGGAQKMSEYTTKLTEFEALPRLYGQAEARKKEKTHVNDTD